ncbi:MAG: histidine phosphatase family protein [Phycisphaerales bacterium JB039]
MAQRSSTKLNLVLVRSGRTEWDLASRLAGRSDHPLSASGREELLSILEDAELPEVGIVLHGPDEASAATAEMLAAKAGARMREVAGLAEADLGLWCGLLPGDLEERYPTAFGQWREDPGAVSVPEGESAADVEGRLVRAVLSATERMKLNGKAVAIVLRPVAFQLFRRRLLDRPLSEVWAPETGPPLLEPFSIEIGALKPRPIQAGA